MLELRSLARAAALGPACAGLLALAAARPALAAEPAEPVPVVPGAGNVAALAGALEPLDVDVYEIDLAAGDLLVAALFDPEDGAFLDTRLGVFAGGGLVAEDDDGGDGFLSRLAFQASAGGTYELRVTGARDVGYTGAHAEGAGTPAPYTLVVGVAAALAQETEPNDAAGQEDALAAGGGLVRGTLGTLDVDRFALGGLPAGAGVAVSLFQLDPATGAPLPGGGGDFDDSRLGLFAGAPFAQDDDGGPGLFSNLLRTPPGDPGEVQIAVTGFRDADFSGAHPEGPFDYVLVAAATAQAAAGETCDVVDPIGQIDRRDIDAIFAARGSPATGPDDPRDADGDGQITIVDGSQCRLRCDFARCAIAPPSCGLLGAEALLALLPLALARRARRRAAAGPEVSA